MVPEIHRCHSCYEISVIRLCLYSSVIFRAYEGKPLAVPPEALGPKPEYLEWHRESVFAR